MKVMTDKHETDKVERMARGEHGGTIYEAGAFELTRESVRNHLVYDLNTGIFTRKRRAGQRGKIGDPAGCVNKRGYIRICIDGGEYSAHRLAFLYVLGYLPEQIDHINHVKSDNRWVNLRPATMLDNNRNHPLHKNNKSGCPGVRLTDNGWVANIKANGVQEYLGCFENKQDAIAARKEAERKHGFHENHGKKLLEELK